MPEVSHASLHTSISIVRDIISYGLVPFKFECNDMTMNIFKEELHDISMLKLSLNYAFRKSTRQQPLLLHPCKRLRQMDSFGFESLS